MPGSSGSAKPTPADIRRGIRASDLPYGEQALLGAILDHDYYGASGLGCIASVETLAAELDTTVRSINRMLVPLLEGGWVTAERKGKHRPLRMGKKCVDSAIRLVRLRTGESLTDSSQPSDAPMTNPSRTHDESVPHPGPIGQPKRDSREGEEIHSAGGVVQPTQEEKSKPKPMGSLKSFQVAKCEADLKRELACVGWTMSAEGDLSERTGWFEPPPPKPKLMERVERYRAHVAAAGGGGPC